MRTFLAVLTFTTFAVGTYSVTKCDAPAVATGDPANITCHFATDIGQARKPFGINKYNASGHQALLRCHWGGNTSVPKCTSLKEGYSYDGNVTSYVVLKISSATDDYVGNYSCQELGSDETVEFCRLRTCKDSGVSCDAPVVTSGQPANITCHFESDIGQTKKPFGIDKRNASGHTALLRCHWPDSQTSVPKCTSPKKGYSYDGNVTTKVVLKISSATEEYLGNYSCQALGSSEDPEPCSLDLWPVEQTKEESGGNAFTIPIIIVVLSVCVISVIMALCCCKDRIRQRFPKFMVCKCMDHRNQASNHEHHAAQIRQTRQNNSNELSLLGHQDQHLDPMHAQTTSSTDDVSLFTVA